MSYLDKINEKKTTASTKADAQQTVDSLIGQLKEVQLATLMGNSKSTVVLADSTDFGDKMAELGDKIMAMLEAFKEDTTNVDKIATLVDDYKKLATYNVKAAREQSDDIKVTLNKLVKSIESIKIPETKIPEVKIPAFPKIPTPIVNVPKNDFSPIERAIESLKEEKGLDLDDYKAHDINNLDKDTQYIGFLNPDGQWYIIENRVKENTIRYVFGKSDYKKAFKKAPTYQYELLSEAVNAL
jgi:hypothetical protein